MRKAFGSLVLSAILAAAAASALCAQAAAAGDRIAVVIGIDDYQTLGKLTTCRNDAKDLASALVAGGYAADRVVLMTDDAAEAPNRPTLATMKRRIQQAAQLAGPEDSLLVYFSGHGITKEGQGYLVPMDGDAETAVPLSWLKDTLAVSKAGSKILILDACHSGSAAKGVAGIAPSMVADAKGIVMLLSSAADQVSYPSDDGKHSIFSQFLMTGLAGQADANGDYAVNEAELFAYITRCMKTWSLKTGMTQTPVSLPETAAGMPLGTITEYGTLCVKVVDAKTGQEITGADVFINGQKAGAAPRGRFRPQKGADFTVEIRGEGLTPYKKTFAYASAAYAGAMTTIMTVRLERTTMQVPPGFHAKEGTTCEPYTSTGWAKEIVHDKTGMEMVFIPAGGFDMGSPDTEVGREDNEGPVHHVRITRPFYLGKYEVTQGEWQKVVVGSNFSRFKGDRNPVETVLWNDCQQFCRGAGDGLMLPTEAQWEYACRAGTTTAFSFGDAENGSDQCGWYSNGGLQTHAVGGKQANAWGLYDMHGNVWEFCSDRYGETYYRSSPADDPAGPSLGSDRVVRGGSFNDKPLYCRSARRNGVDPTVAAVNVGLRVARGL